MPRAQELEQVSPGTSLWHTYDSKVKADLFSTALETHSGIYIVDPIPLASEALLILQAHHPKTAGIFVTNANHARAATDFGRTLSVPLYVHDELRESPEFLQATGVQDGEMFAPGLTAVALDGGAAGEMALHHNGNGGTMIVGDALINFEPHGFGLLPAKYCLDPKRMRQSLEKLLDYAFERILFAHGTPILSEARRRLEHLLAEIR
jgi:glyoxylase-like metal-dependent hydrolase (beta-lactamase superfamily II)